MIRLQAIAIAIAILSPAAAEAQELGETAAGDTDTDNAATGREQPPSKAPAIWIAGASGGVLASDSGPDSPYGTLSLTRYRGTSYLRAAATVYHGTVRQVDAALPSIFYLGSIGAGGNWNDWVVDAFASYGRQDYGEVETEAGKRASEAGSGAPYVAVGLRAGRVFHPAPHLYLTPTLGIQYSDTRSPRHRVDFMSGQPEDFKLREKAWTGNAALRVDYALGRYQQHFAGLSIAHFEGDNGLTSWRLDNVAGANQPVAVPMPDSWEELGLSTTLRLSERIWLDNEVRRTFGAVAGDTTSITVGFRVRM